MLSVLLRLTDSHYPFGIFRLFYNQMEGNIDRIHDDSLYWPGTDTSIKSVVVELVLRAKAKRELKEINKLGENRNNNDY